MMALQIVENQVRRDSTLDKWNLRGIQWKKNGLSGEKHKINSTNNYKN
jgi:hypothetical protein